MIELVWEMRLMLTLAKIAVDGHLARPMHGNSLLVERYRRIDKALRNACILNFREAFLP